jgi:hypothetical protein
MAGRVLITARYFTEDPAPLDYLRAHDCELVASAYGGEKDDRSITEVVAVLEGKKPDPACVVNPAVLQQQ